MMTDFEKYVQRYLDLIPTSNWREELKSQGQITLDFYQSISEEQSLFAYADGKWTLKELLLHLSDTERVFQYRLLCIARGEKSELPGFDEELYAQNSFANSRSLGTLIQEFQLIRNSTQILVDTLESSVLQNRGVANGNEISAETIAQLIVGHNIHHLSIIKERYLPGLKL